MQPPAFAALLAASRARHAAFRVHVGEAGPEGSRIGALRLEAWLAAEAAQVPGMDRKAQAAFLMGRFAGQLGRGFGALHLEHGVVPEVAPDAMAWQAGCDSGLDWVLPPGSTARMADADALRGLVVALCAPMVEGLSAATALPQAALWRLATDSLGYAFLDAGRRLGVEAVAMAAAVELTKAAASPLRNRQSGFMRVEAGGRAQWFIARGGCCRWLTCPGGGMCLVCVLRPAAERAALLRDHLSRQDPS